MNDCVLMYQVMCHANRTALQITTGNTVAFYSIFWSAFFQNDSAWLSITTSPLKKEKKPQNFKNICSMTLFNKDVGF